MKIDIIDHEVIKDLNLAPTTILQWVDTVFHMKSQTVLPAKISLKQENHVFFNFMPCIIPSENVVGAKIISRHPQHENNTPSLRSKIFLYDLHNGDMLAILDGSYITTMRTGAIAAYSVNMFAVKNFSTIGVLGLGNTAYATFDVLTNLYTDREIHVKVLKYKDQAEHFINRYTKNTNFHFTIVESEDELVHDSDVIISCITFSDHDISDVSNYKAGCVIIPVHTLGFQNCDLAFDKVFADDTNPVRSFKYFDKFKNFAEVGDVTNGKSNGRCHDNERILVYNIGLGIFDTYIAYQIMKMVDSSKSLDFSEPYGRYCL